MHCMDAFKIAMKKLFLCHDCSHITKKCFFTHQVRTTGLAGGLLHPYKGLTPLAPGRRTDGLPATPHSQLPLKGLFQCFLPLAQPYKGPAGLL